MISTCTWSRTIGPNFDANILAQIFEIGLFNQEYVVESGVVVGLGNIYVNEVLNRSGVSSSSFFNPWSKKMETYP